MADNGEQERNQQPSPQPQGGPAGGGGFTLSGKTLGIAGGGAAALVVVIVVVALLATGVFGGGGSGGASGGGDVLAYVPGDAAGVHIADVQTYLHGEVPEDYRDYLLERDKKDPEAYEALDIDDDDVRVVAIVTDANFDEKLEIVQGDFNFDIIREDLEDGLDCEDDDYRGYELWECPSGEFQAVALFEKNGYLVFALHDQGDLEDMLTLKSRTPEKLANAEDSDIKRILDQVDNGWIKSAVITDSCPIERCEGIAYALQESDDGASVPVSYTVLFSSERAAAAAEGDVEIDDLVEELFANRALDLDIGEVKAAGEFVVGDGIAEFVEPDDTSSRSSSSRSGGQSAATPATPEAALPPARAAPAAPAATNAPALALLRGDWLEDCANVTLEQTNQYLARHEQIGRDAAYGHCECLYDYFEEWEGPPTVTVSDVVSGRLGADALSYADLYWDASSYCAW